MSAFDHFAENVAILVGTGGRPGLLAALVAPASHLVNAESAGRRTPPGSRPPVRVDLVDVEREIRQAGLEWNLYLGGSARTADAALRQLPALAEHLDPDDERLHGRDGLFAQARSWMRRCRLLLGLDEIDAAYPDAPCPDCYVVGGIRGRPADGKAWCSCCGAAFSRLGFASLIYDSISPIT